MSNNRSGKYYKPPERKKGKIGAVIGIMAAVIVLLCAAVGGYLVYLGTGSAYQQIQRRGYRGTEEQWLASLVGEDLGQEQAKSAYDLACEAGFRGSRENWMKTMTGVSSAGEGMTAYELACSNGYIGTLERWLEQLADNPDELGRSDNPDHPTSYELACQFGYTGTFIEWIVSVTHDKIF